MNLVCLILYGLLWHGVDAKDAEPARLIAAPVPEHAGDAISRGPPLGSTALSLQSEPTGTAALRRPRNAPGVGPDLVRRSLLAKRAISVREILHIIKTGVVGYLAGGPRLPDLYDPRGQAKWIHGFLVRHNHELHPSTQAHITRLAPDHLRFMVGALYTAEEQQRQYRMRGQDLNERVLRSLHVLPLREPTEAEVRHILKEGKPMGVPILGEREDMLAELQRQRSARHAQRRRVEEGEL